MLLPYSVTLGATRKSTSELNKTAPAGGDSTTPGGSSRPATTGGGGRSHRSTILSVPGSKFVDESPDNIDNDQEADHSWENENFEEYGTYEEPETGEEEKKEREYDATDDDNLFFQPVPSLSDSKKTTQSGKKQKKKQSSVFQPPKPKKDEFRREYSKDHPLAPGGKGKYEQDRAGGKKHPVGWIDNDNLDKKDEEQPQQYEKVVIHKAKNQHADTAVKDVATWQAEIDAMRRQQNQALLKLLEEERLAEEDRGKMGKLVKDHEERHRLELVFSEERKRASERIISLTRQHELNIKEAQSRIQDAEATD